MRKYARWVHAEHKDDIHYLLNNIRTLGDRGEAGLKDPKWQPILIDVNKVKSVKFMLCVFNIEFFMKGGFDYAAGHGQMIFEFEEGGAMLPDREVNGIVNSFEILPKEGESYDPIVKGELISHYKTTFSISTMEYSVLGSATNDTRFEIVELDLSKEEMVSLLKISMEEALKKDQLQSKKYDTTRNSCITNQIRVLNLFLEANGRGTIQEYRKGFITEINYIRTRATFVPKKVIGTLIDHGLTKTQEAQKYSNEQGMALASQLGSSKRRFSFIQDTSDAEPTLEGIHQE